MEEKQGKESEVRNMSKEFEKLVKEIARQSPENIEKICLFAQGVIAASASRKKIGA